ncbi:MAG TPA: proteasome subunit beta, partial [Methanothermococcus okinawensis]|nr:proteasome subunit beta [Methanothermococcus okinawensis]
MEYMKGTTTIGLICKDGIVLATDRRATMGNLIADKEAKKLYKIDDYIAITIAG